MSEDPEPSPTGEAHDDPTAVEPTPFEPQEQWLTYREKDKPRTGRDAESHGRTARTTC